MKVNSGTAFAKDGTGTYTHEYTTTAQSVPISLDFTSGLTSYKYFVKVNSTSAATTSDTLLSNGSASTSYSYTPTANATINVTVGQASWITVSANVNATTAPTVNVGNTSSPASNLPQTYYYINDTGNKTIYAKATFSSNSYYGKVATANNSTSTASLTSGTAFSGTIAASLTGTQAYVNVYQVYTVAYNAGQATSGTAPSSQLKFHGVTLTLQTNSGSLAKTGYTYKGWSTTNSDNDGTPDYSAGGSYTSNSGTTLYPAWQINSYTLTVKYYSQLATNDTTLTVKQGSTSFTGSPITKPSTNGSPTAANQATYTVNYSTTAVSITLSATNSSSYTYYIEKDGACTTSSSTNSKSVDWTPSSSATWNIYIAQRYTIAYGAGQATSGTAPATQYKVHGTNLTLQTNSGSLAKTGYTYKGWSTTNNDNDGTPDYAAGGSYTSNSGTTLYPAWQINTYTLTAANGYWVANPSSTITVTATAADGSTVTLSSNGTTTTNGTITVAKGKTFTVSHTYSSTTITVTDAEDDGARGRMKRDVVV